jgi:DNA-binding HxlR family transcriptional regulator
LRPACGKPIEQTELARWPGEWWWLATAGQSCCSVRHFTEYGGLTIPTVYGVATNILSSRLKRLVQLGIMAKVPGERARRYEYVLTEKGRDFLPAYLALKGWCDKWFSHVKGPQVRFEERRSGNEIQPSTLRKSRGRPLRLEDLAIVPASGATPFNLRRFSRSRLSSAGDVRSRRRRGAK